MKRQMVTIALLLVLFVAACQPASSGQVTAFPAEVQEDQNLTVFAAASLTEAFGEIGVQFEASHPGVKIIFNYANSYQLAQQLAQGAPADVFASANQKQMQEAVKAGRVSQDQVKDLAGNRLVIIYPVNSQNKIQQIQDLAQPGLLIVLAADEIRYV